MSSPITFSGFNNIDFSYILTAIMTQESQPVLNLQAQQTALKSQKTAFSTLASKLSSLEDSIQALSNRTEFGGRTATSTNDAAVKADASSAASVGSYDIVVSELAKAQATASSLVPDKDITTVATGGSIVVNGVAIAVTVPATLQDVADAINASDEIDVAASVVSVSPGNYQLVLTGKSTGTGGAFTVQNNLTGGSGLTFGANAQDAKNASFTVNGVSVSSASNTVDDVIPGVSLQLLKKDPASTVTVNVTQDEDAAKGQVKAFVDAFNELMTFAGDQTKAANSGDKNNIGRDALLRGLRNDLRGAINSKFTTGSKFEYLSQIGIGFARDGSMKFDEAKFDEATKGGNGEVLKLFTGSDGTSGAFGAIDTLLNGYTQAGGLLPNAEDRVDSQLTSIGVRIDAMNARLALRRDALSKEFTATDTAISALNNSINSLSSLNSQYRLF